MGVRELLSLWESTASDPITEETYNVRLSVKDAARIRALVELYPRRETEQIITDLLTASLDELERVMPYIRGPRIVATDEQGDPMYEDVGPTPRYLSLTEKYFHDYNQAHK